jgi:hypothetical protein
LARRLGRNVLRVDIGVLPCPAYFDQVLFCMEAYTKRNTIARARVEYDPRVRPCDMGIDREPHAHPITHERSEFETQWFCLGLLLCAESRGERDEEQRRDDKRRIDRFLSQCSASDSDAYTTAVHSIMPYPAPTSRNRSATHPRDSPSGEDLRRAV